MPKNKNNPNKPNGFVMYANEIKNQLLKEGYEIRNMPDLIQAASPKWQVLPHEEKEYYKEKAKWEWDNRHITGKFQKERPNRVNIGGSVIRDQVDTVRMIQMKREKERQEVFMSFPAGRAVLEQKFYFVSFICLLEEPAHQPIELGAVQFSLLHGIERSLHKHIDPGPIPMGFRFTAEQRSELTHKLPVEGKMDPLDTYTKIYDELFQFMSRGTRHIPPIFAKISECEQVELCLKWLATNAGRPHHLKRVYELEGLMLDLDDHLFEKPQNLMQFKQPATEILSSSAFDWDSGTRCEFHEDEENETDSKHCALGKVNRYCYCIADYFCKNHDIPITERHLPVNRSDLYYTVIPSKEKKTSRHALQQQRQQHRMDSCANSAHGEPPVVLGEDIANLVAERLRIENESQKQIEKQRISEENAERRKQEEQKKRWMALRGSPSKPTSPPEEQVDAIDNNQISVSQQQQQHHHQQQHQQQQQQHHHQHHHQQQQQQQQQQQKYKVIGRGRGRGTIMANNLRRPGEKPVGTHPSGTQPPMNINSFQGRTTFGVGRGTKLHLRTADEGPKYASSTSAPHPSEAPKPPNAWMR